LDKVLLPLDFFGTKAPASAPIAAAKAPKSDKGKSSSAEDDDESSTTQDQKSSGAMSLLGIQGAKLICIGISFVAVTMLWS
jgi:hypothetical protein